MKFLIVGLGNIGDEYARTRHNIGFDIADALVSKHGGSFTSSRYADHAQLSIKGKQVHVIKPSTYMNLSGKAVRHWMQELKTDLSHVFVLVDDLAIPYGKVRIRKNGSDAGHNGLKNIQELMGTQEYPRLRFGIGNDFPKGRQIEFVLGKWSDEENRQMPELMKHSVDAIEAFVHMGIDRAMNFYNK